LTKTGIINEISLNSRLTKREILNIVDMFLEKVKESADRDEQVEIRGFGTFYRASKKARKVHSPIAGRVLEVPEKTILAFRGSKETEKETIKGA
jgi:DNA-binding protein HU-beta